MTGDDLARLLDLVRAELDQPDASAEDLWREPSHWDSLTLVNILFVSEERFNVTFTPEQMERVRGLVSLIATIDEACLASQQEDRHQDQHRGNGEHIAQQQLPEVTP